MKIRVAQAGDLPNMVDIYNQAIRTGKTANLKPETLEARKVWFEEHSPSKYPNLVAEEGGEITAYLSLSAYRPGREALQHTAEISYFVHVDHFRQGIASELLLHALNLCPQLEIHTLLAILLENNLSSIRLLEKFGFVKWGHLPEVAEFKGQKIGQFIYGKQLREELRGL